MSTRHALLDERCIRVFRDGCWHRVLKVPYPQAIIGSGALPGLRNLLNSSKGDICKFACRIIEKLINDAEETTQAVIEANMVPPYIRAIPCAGFDMGEVR